MAGVLVSTSNELPKEIQVSNAKTTNSGPDMPLDSWQPVRNKKNKQQIRAKSLDSKGVDLLNSSRLGTAKDDLPFLLDEELSDQQLSGRKKAYTDHDDFDEELDDYEISDHDLSKIIIVMQTPRKSGEQVYDRTGDWTTRVKVTQEMGQIINDGLFYYEQDLWARFGDSAAKQHKTLGLISKEDFEIYSGSPKKNSGFSSPPPPPPSTFVDEDIEFDETYLGGTVWFQSFS